MRGSGAFPCAKFCARQNCDFEKAGDEKMNILVIDAQGGGIGKQLVASLRQEIPAAVITAIGTNAIASSAMLKAGAHRAATGENPVVVACRSADVIVGPVGIVIADALMGEITPTMAQAVAQSRAKRILIPFNCCDNLIVGLSEGNITKLVKAAVEEIKKFA